jgi:hypothetical protein
MQRTAEVGSGRFVVISLKFMGILERCGPHLRTELGELRFPAPCARFHSRERELRLLL